MYLSDGTNTSFMKLKYPLLAGCLFAALHTHAQKPWRVKQIYRANPPKAIFVQLFTYPRRIEYYKKNRRKEELSLFQASANAANQQIIKDFNENFDFCPVYYYYDTNATNIRERNFATVLLNKDLAPATNIPVQAADTNYFIVMNSMLMSEDFLPGEMYGEDESLFTARDNVNSNKPRIVVYDYKFRQLPRSTTVRTPTGPRDDEDGRRHTYTSRVFNLQYSGKASVLNRNFHEFFNMNYDH